MKRLRPGTRFGKFKCDAPGCGYVSPNETPDFEFLEEYVDYMKSYLDVACPRCGAPLLTQADFDSAVLVLKIAHDPLVTALEKVSSLFGKKKSRVRVSFDGTGKITVNDET